jgi:RNA polymerase sigma-70 factor, ECF subfamily
MAAAGMPDLGPVFEGERSFLWAVSYRLTGSASDADDVVQEAFVRALERPPADRERPWRPWLLRVALNVGRDLLRRRRRRSYDGPWLPELVATGEEASPPSFVPRDDGPGARYDRLESVSLAFLLALEALTPAQRAVLLLRDVFDYSVRETGEALDLTEANVKTTHLRARRAMERYDRARCIPTPRVQAQAAETLQRFLLCLAAHDVAGVESMLAEDVRAVSDGGGEFHTARRVILGADRVTRFFVGLTTRMGATAQVAILSVNGLPAVQLVFPPRTDGFATRVVIQLRLDDRGRVDGVYLVLSTPKLAALAGRPLPFA